MSQPAPPKTSRSVCSGGARPGGPVQRGGVVVEEMEHAYVDHGAFTWTWSGTPTLVASLGQVQPRQSYCRFSC